jgi:hypothetical protein
VIQGGIIEDGLPSCSAVEALERQEPFVNPTLANHALAPCSRGYFATEQFPDHGAFVSLSCVGEVQALRVDSKCWQRLREKPRLPSQLEAKWGASA